jgi:hypothetical protein
MIEPSFTILRMRIQLGLTRAGWQVCSFAFQRKNCLEDRQNREMHHLECYLYN